MSPRICQSPPGLTASRPSQQASPGLDCCICHGALHMETPDLCTTRCGHKFHTDCLLNWNRRSCQTTPTCPLCRAPLGDDVPTYSTEPRISRHPGHPAGTSDPWNIRHDTTGTTSVGPPLGPHFQVTPGLDWGLPKSLPPPTCYTDFLQAWDPIVVVSPPVAINRQQAPWFSSQCPWIQAGTAEAYTVAEMAGIQNRRRRGRSLSERTALARAVLESKWVTQQPRGPMARNLAHTGGYWRGR
jgi:hypothetical protein